jgi:hypothetical protein
MPNVEHKTNPVVGLLGIVSLIAGVDLFAAGRQVDEPEAQQAGK